MINAYLVNVKHAEMHLLEQKTASLYHDLIPLDLQIGAHFYLTHPAETSFGQVPAKNIGMRQQNSTSFVFKSDLTLRV